MILACITQVVILYCGDQFNYVHDLISGKQKASKTGLYLTDDERGVLVHPFDGKEFQIPASSFCFCPIPPEAKK